MKALKQLENMLGTNLINALPAIVAAAKEEREERIQLMSTEAGEETPGREPQVLSVDVMYDSIQNNLIGNVWLLASPQTEYAIMQVRMFQKDKLIAGNTFADIRPDTLDLHVIGQPTEPVVAEDLHIEVIVVDKVRDSIMKGTSSTYAVDQLLGIHDVVKRIEVKDPRNIITDVGTTIHVSFDRKSQLMNRVDYDYTKYRVGTGEQPVYLDMSGEIYLADGYEYIENSYKTEEIFLRKGDAFYKYNNPEITPQYDKVNNKLVYQYPNKWNCNFPKNMREVSMLADYRMQASFRYKDQNAPGQEKTCMVIVSSKDYFYMQYKDGNHPSNYRVIPNILFYWGCVEENTKITMEDGSDKKIKDIRIGDRVRSVDGKSSLVCDIFRGTEEQLYCIDTVSGHEILVTKDHPFLTDSGEKAAIELCYADRIQMENGEFGLIEGAFPVEKHFVVYSLDLDPSGYFFGNGMAVGDWKSQGKVYQTYLEKNNVPVDEEIQKECQFINEELYQSAERR